MHPEGSTTNVYIATNVVKRKFRVQDMSTFVRRSGKLCWFAQGSSTNSELTFHTYTVRTQAHMHVCMHACTHAHTHSYTIHNIVFWGGGRRGYMVSWPPGTCLIHFTPTKSTAGTPGYAFHEVPLQEARNGPGIGKDQARGDEGNLKSTPVHHQHKKKINKLGESFQIQ